jgi:phosphatidylglycerol:prolipoprotein diacylglycerol transferase
MELFINPVILKIGIFELRWYSLAYIMGFILAGFLAVFMNRYASLEQNISGKKFDVLINYCILGVILGGRLGYVLFYDLAYFLNNPTKILAVWEGGMSFHGGFLGVLIAILLFSRKNNIDVWHIFDRASFCVLPGLFFGRIANFINGELWGRPTDFWFSFIFPSSGDFLTRHPSQLYEALFEGLIPFIIFFILLKKTDMFKKTGFFSGLFCIFYGIGRFVIEMFFREPHGTFDFEIFTLSTGQLLCLPMILAGVLILLKKNKV